MRCRGARSMPIQTGEFQVFPCGFGCCLLETMVASHSKGDTHAKRAAGVLRPMLTQSPAHSPGFGRLLTEEQSAAYLGISVWSIRQYVPAGDLLEAIGELVGRW